jgi:hypothetical protein
VGVDGPETSLTLSPPGDSFVSMAVAEKLKEGVAVNGREKDLGESIMKDAEKIRCTEEMDEDCVRALIQKIIQEEVRIYFDRLKTRNGVTIGSLKDI